MKFATVVPLISFENTVSTHLVEHSVIAMIYIFILSMKD